MGLTSAVPSTASAVQSAELGNKLTSGKAFDAELVHEKMQELCGIIREISDRLNQRRPDAGHRSEVQTETAAAEAVEVKTGAEGTELSELLASCDNTLAGIAAIAEAFQIHIFDLAMERVFGTGAGASQRSDDENLSSEDKLWFENLRIFECYLKAVFLSQNSAALKAHLDVNVESDRLTEEGRAKLLSTLSGLGGWTEKRHKALTDSAEKYKNALACYFDLRMEQNVGAGALAGPIQSTLDAFLMSLPVCQDIFMYRLLA